MGTIKAIVKKQYKQFEGVFDIGDEVEITSKLSTEPKVVHYAWYNWIDWKDKSKGKYLAAPELVAPIGTFEGFIMKNLKTGHEISDHMITNCIGYHKLNEFLVKV